MRTRKPLGGEAARSAVVSDPPAPIAAEASAADPSAASLQAADREIVLGSAMTGATDPFMIPYALALHASHFEVALLSSARNLMLALVQLGSDGALRRLGSRKSLVLWTVGLQALLWLPLAAAQPLFGSFAVPALILCYTLGTASAALGAPAWASLLADYVDPGERGRYFGRRARLGGISTSAASATAGGLLQLCRGRGTLGFALLCALAGLCRLGSWRALTRLRESPWQEQPHLRFSFAQFLRGTPRSNFARFSLCVAAHAFAANLASPYFAVYMIDGIGYSYATYTIVTLCGALTGMCCGPIWGRLGDRAGNHAILAWTLIAVAPLPVLWLLSPHPLWMATANAAGGFFWAGVTLSAGNYVYDAVSPGKRHTCIAYFNVLNGLGVSLGAFTGGALVRVLGEHGTPFALVFCVSAALRLASGLAFSRCAREIRDIEPLGVRDLWRALLQPATGGAAPGIRPQPD